MTCVSCGGSSLLHPRSEPDAATSTWEVGAKPAFLRLLKESRSLNRVSVSFAPRKTLEMLERSAGGADDLLLLLLLLLGCPARFAAAGVAGWGFGCGTGSLRCVPAVQELEERSGSGLKAASG